MSSSPTRSAAHPDGPRQRAVVNGYSFDVQFETRHIDAGGARIFVRCAGSGPPLLLLHGFPQTNVMWSRVAAELTDHFTVVCADLRGYGQSSCPPSAADHAPYSKRAMALDMVALMSTLGHPRFGIAGHDRGGRVAYRLSLDHPEVVSKLAVLDIIPTGDAWDRADASFATAYWPWSLLAQAEPLPERLVSSAPASVVEAALTGWGSPPDAFDDATRAAYVDALSGADHVHAICEEYRAAAAIDRTDDATDRRAGRRIIAPVLVLWSESGPLGSWYESEGGPLGVWRQWADDVRGRPMPGGHFFPEEHPRATAAQLSAFFAAAEPAVRSPG